MELLNSYGSLAGCYDQLTTDVNYDKWAEYIHQHFQKQDISVKTVLDLACGTGSLTVSLAKMGYEMIGVDLSPDMLSQALGKCADIAPPLFLCQAMEELDLYGTIDGCVCCLDSINYVTEPEKLQEAFRRVFLFLLPKGVFLFDIKSPSALLKQNGQISLDETEDVYCVWRTESSSETEICHHYMDLFLRDGDIWVKEEEIHKQRIYSSDLMIEFLEKAGFENIQQLGNLSFSAPSDEEERLFFLAEKPANAKSNNPDLSY